MSDLGKLLMFSGPSGVGKTDLITLLLQENTQMEHAISHTTRDARPHETPGVHYHFVSRSEFERLAEQGQFADHREIHGNYYGLSMMAIIDIVSAGRHAITDVDVKGAEAIKEKFPEAYTFFLMPDDLSELKVRIARRGGLSGKEQEMRMHRAQMEMSVSSQFDFQLSGSNTRELADQVKHILGGSHWHNT